MKKSVYLSSLLAFCFSFLAIVAKAQPVVTNPVNDTTCVMDTAFFSVTVTGATPITYQWNWSDDAGASWDTVMNGGIYANATTASLRIIPANTEPSGMWYRSIVFNSAGSDTSDWAMLTVDTGFAGVISGMSPLCVGSTLALTSSAPGGVWSNVDHTIDTISAAGILEGRDFGVDTIKYTLTNTCGTFVSRSLSRIDTVVVALPIAGPTHVCVGGSITLVNLNTIGTGTWSSTSGNTMPASTGHITGLTAGTDVISYEFSNACNSVTTTYNVTVEVLPSAGTITPSMDPPTFCTGTWMHYTPSVSGGIWLSGSPSIATVSMAGNVTGVSQGTAIISYFMTNSCGIALASDTVKVEAVAAAISGNDSVGIDSMLLLSNLTPGGAWTSADTTIAKFVLPIGTIKGIDTGVTTVTYTVMNSCGTSTATLPMNVGPLPSAGTITGPDSVCTGTSITLRASVKGGTWLSRHDTLATVTPTTPATDSTTLVNGIETGRDTVVYTVVTAFGRSTVRKPIFVNQPPAVYVTGPGSVALAGAYDLLAFPSGGSFTSSNPSMGLITATSTAVDSSKLKSVGSFAVLDTGTTVFTYTVSNTCGTRSRTFTIHLPGGGGTNVGNVTASAAMNVYPNPSQGALVFSMTGTKSEAVTVVVTDIAGRMVKTFTSATNTKTEFALNEPAGVYLLTARTAAGQVQTARITINN